MTEPASQLTPTQRAELEGVPVGTFVSLSSDAGKLVGLLYKDEPLNPFKSLDLRPDRLPPDILDFGLLTLIPLYQERTAVGWVVQVPNLPVFIGPHYLMVKRRSVVMEDDEQPRVVLNIKSLVAMTVSDGVVSLFSTQARDVRT